MNRKVKIKCYLCDTISTYQFHVKIFDERKCLIFDKDTDCLGEAEFFIKKFGVYKIVIIPKSPLNPRYISKYIYIDNDTKVLPFAFSINCYHEHQIIVELTDRYYSGLPVLKGEVDLWQ